MSANGSVVTFDNFNPNQKIQLNSKVNRIQTQTPQNRRLIQRNGIDFSEKINLKSGVVKNEPRPPPLLIRQLNSDEKINLKVKLQPKGLLPSSFTTYQPPMPPLSLSEHNQTINLKVKKEVQSIPNSVAWQTTSVSSFVDPNQTIYLQKQQKKREQKMSVSTQPLTMEAHLKMLNEPRQPIKKNRLRDQNTDFTSLRYQCFCQKQYLSYCAAYHHLKKEHPQFLRENKRFSFTNIIDCVDPVHGFKIKKIMEQRLKRKPDDVPTLGQHLSRKAKRKIKLKSQQIRNLTYELQQLQKQREIQVRSLHIYERKIMKANELVNEYQKMIYSYESILGVLNIRRIMEGLKVGMTYAQEEAVDPIDENDEQYFPQ